MSHKQPCRLGFAGSICPACHRADSDRRARLELHHRVIDADETTLRDVAHWLIGHDADALKDALDEVTR